MGRPAIESGTPPERLSDIDSTDDPVHGQQEGRFYHGYYGHYCLLPLYAQDGPSVRPGGADPAGDVTGPLGRVIARLPRVAVAEGPGPGRLSSTPARS